VKDEAKDKENKTDNLNEKGVVNRAIKLFEMQVENESEAEKSTEVEEMQLQFMRKSIFAYWSVFTGRFIDNLHMRL
jgi:phosphoribosylformylglycinamidine (FGAM) synthase PurS component